MKLRDRLHRARLDRRKQNENPLAAAPDADAPDWFVPLPGDGNGAAEAIPAAAPATRGHSKEIPIVHSDDITPDDDVRGRASTADAEIDIEVTGARPLAVDDDVLEFDGDIPGFTDWREELRERLKRIKARREQERLTEGNAAEKLGTGADVDEPEPDEPEADEMEAIDVTEVAEEIDAVEETENTETDTVARIEGEADLAAADDVDAEEESEVVVLEEDDEVVVKQNAVVGFGAAIAGPAAEPAETPTAAEDDVVLIDVPTRTAGDLIAQLIDGPAADPEEDMAGPIAEPDDEAAEEPAEPPDDDPEEAAKDDADFDWGETATDELEPFAEAVPELDFDEAAPLMPTPALDLDLPEADAENDQAFEWDQEVVEPAAKPSSAGPLGERAAAALCDLLVLTAIGSALVGAASSGTGLPFRQVLVEEALALGIAWGIFAIGYSVFFVGSCGQTIGRMVMRLRVVGTDQFSVGFGRAAVRLAAWVVSALPLLAGMLPALRDPQRRGLHDRLSRTRVVKA